MRDPNLPVPADAGIARATASRSGAWRVWRARTLCLLAGLSSLQPMALPASSWTQWGANATHDNSSDAVAQEPAVIVAESQVDPHVGIETSNGAFSLLVHYQAPIVDGDAVFMTYKDGTYTTAPNRNSQVWSVQRLRLEGDALALQWRVASDWKPVPYAMSSWEPVFHPALGGAVLYVPGFGGSVLRLDRASGALLGRIAPFGEPLDPDMFTTGPLTVGPGGDLYYNVTKFAPTSPQQNDVAGAWLVHVSPDGAIATATYASLVPSAPASTAQCLTQYIGAALPWPPPPPAAPATVTCGSQRPGVNIGPALAPDGTIYTISRAHFSDRWGYLVAVKPDLTPKWQASLRDRLNDGCNVLIPPNGAAGGCRIGAATGIDPSDGTAGAGRVLDLSSSTPAVTPDGTVMFGAYTRYNYSAGHLMHFSATGDYLGAYRFGWDLTPAFDRHDGTWSVIIKDNRYAAGSYCDDPTWCPANRATVTPSDPERYLLVRLDADLQVEWQYESTETKSCMRLPDGTLSCQEDHPYGFEWCINAVAVDAAGTTFANSEDGRLYAIDRAGVKVADPFLQLALGAAYTPLSIGPNGLVYTQNYGRMFVLGARMNAIHADGFE